MSLFDKLNPKATRCGLVMALLLGSLVGVADWWLFTLGNPEMRVHVPYIISAIWGAAAVGAIYWQGWPD